MMVDELKDRLIGQDPMRTEWLWDRLYVPKLTEGARESAPEQSAVLTWPFGISRPSPWDCRCTGLCIQKERLFYIAYGIL